LQPNTPFGNIKDSEGDRQPLVTEEKNAIEARAAKAAALDGARVNPYRAYEGPGGASK
jgi:hypothetical protein